MTSTEPRSGSEQKAVEALAEAVDEFLHHLSARHIDVGGVCDVCGDDRGPKDWPCPTAALIEDFRADFSSLVAALAQQDEKEAAKGNAGALDVKDWVAVSDELRELPPSLVAESPDRA